jgi:HlyD family secretion protein
MPLELILTNEFEQVQSPSFDSLPAPAPVPTKPAATLLASPTAHPVIPKAPLPVESEPRRRKGTRWWIYLIPLLLIGGAAITFALSYSAIQPLLANNLGGVFVSKRPDLIMHKARKEFLQVNVVERGTLESADNREVVCKVKAGSKGTFASTIRWVIDDGTNVSKGQLLMELDDSSLQDQFRAQSIVVEKARAEWSKADEELVITTKLNDSEIATAQASLKVAELDLDKFLGVRADPQLARFASVCSSLAMLLERGEYRQKLDEVSGQLNQAKSDLQALTDRVLWAERSNRLGYLTPSQVKVEQAKMASLADNVEKLTKQKYVLETFQKQRDLTDLTSKLEVAKMGYDRSIKSAQAKENQAENTRRTTYSVFQQEQEKLRDIEEQILECKIFSPQTGMVVYYKEAGGRFGNSNEGLIQQGAQVKEGQKLLRIPDLKKMQVNTRVHEAMISRIKGDIQKSTGFFDTLRAGLLLNPNGFSRLIGHSELAISHFREIHRKDEYVLAGNGDPATIRVDAFPDKVLNGHVRTVAAVASQQDWMSSDVKVYQTLVIIDDVLSDDRMRLKPDMSAEVTIQVDPPKEPVLCVPIQAIYGGAEVGSKRKIFVMSPSGPVEREVTLGLFNEKLVEVRDGLTDGEEVILNPKAILGDKAKTREDDQPSARRPGQGAGMGKDKGKAAPGGAPGGGKGGPGKTLVQ